MLGNGFIRQLSSLQKMVYYAVAKGRKVGIYETWALCQAQVTGFKGAAYKKFPTRGEAEEFIQQHGSGDSGYNPQDILIPLGVKGQPPTNWKNIASKSEKTNSNQVKKDDFWPEETTDVYDDDAMTESELLAALNEVEGLPGSSKTTSKRKLDEKASTSNAKVPKHESIIREPAGIKRVGDFDFLIDCEGFVIAYTDGSCLRNGQANACAGYGVYFGDGHALNVGKPVTGRVTNNVGEIQAAIYAIKIALDFGIKKLCISTDSQFLINAITLWVSGWKRRNWRLKNGEPVKNVADFKELDELLDTNNIFVKWNYVKGHKGIKGNEMADKLAREGSAIYEKLHCRK